MGGDSQITEKGHYSTSVLPVIGARPVPNLTYQIVNDLAFDDATESLAFGMSGSRIRTSAPWTKVMTKVILISDGSAVLSKGAPASTVAIQVVLSGCAPYRCGKDFFHS